MEVEATAEGVGGEIDIEAVEVDLMLEAGEEVTTFKSQGDPINPEEVTLALPKEHGGAITKDDKAI